MDSDTLKTLATVVAAIASVASARFAWRIHKKTRGDAFEALQHSVARLVTENDQTQRDLEFKIFVYRDRIIDARATKPTSKRLEELDATAVILDGIEEGIKGINARGYTLRQLDSLTYSEEFLSNLRSAERNEYQRKIFFSSHSVQVGFELAEKVLPFVREA